jgi:hypothetical protein
VLREQVKIDHGGRDVGGKVNALSNRGRASRKKRIGGNRGMNAEQHIVISCDLTQLPCGLVVHVPLTPSRDGLVAKPLEGVESGQNRRNQKGRLS